MFEWFNQPAINVVLHAQKEGRSVGYLGAEHILLGLLHEENRLASNALRDVGVTSELAELELAKLPKDDTKTLIADEQIPFTPRAKHIMELAWYAASEFKQNYIGTEHVLLGLIRDRGGKAVAVLNNLNVSLENLETNLIGKIRTNQN